MSEDILEKQLFEIIKDEKMEEHIKVAKIDMLIRLGVDVNAKVYRNRTALMFASNKGFIKIAKLLVENGADVNQKDKDGDTALKRASYNGHKEVVELLIKAKADVNQKNQIGVTALMSAKSAIQFRL